MPINPNIICEFNSPKTWENLPPTTKTDFWNYSEIYCETTDASTSIQFLKNELIQNATTGAEFFVEKSVSYGDFLVITFLMIFLIFGIMKFIVDFIIPKRINFKR